MNIIITVARKPPSEGTLAKNAMKHGTGGLNIDGARIPASGRPHLVVHALRDDVTYHGNALMGRVDGSLASSKSVGVFDLGRWPANLILASPEAVEALDEQSGLGASKLADRGHSVCGTSHRPGQALETKAPAYTVARGHNDAGGASRFFKRVAADIR